MPVIKLTEKSIERIPLASGAEPVEYYDTRLAGFGVRSGAKSKTYFVKIALGGKQFKRSLGKVGVILFVAAQNAARQAIQDAGQGVTPDERRQLDQPPESITLQAVFKKYLAVRKNLRTSTATMYKTQLDRYLADWMMLPMNQITPAMVVTRHAEVGKKSPAMADGTFRIIRALYNFGMEVYEDELQRNPVKRLSTLKAWYKVPRKTGFIKPTQLPLFMSLLHKHSGMVADYLEALLFTGIRSASEIAKLQIKDVDIKENTIILYDTKTKDQLYIPVCATTMQALQRRITDAKAAGTTYLFYSFAGKEDVGYFVDVRTKIKGMLTGTELAHITPHDLRRTFLTYADELEIPNVVQKRLVGHAIPTDVTDGYKVLTMERLRNAVNKVEAFILQHAQAKDQ